MSDAVDGGLDELRNVLFQSEREELEELRLRVAQLEGLVARIAPLEGVPGRVDEIESLLLEQGDRAQTVGGVLPDAISYNEENVEQLSMAMKTPTARAIYHSARDESGDLALALYPVIGPAVRKMIASLFSIGPPDGAPFSVRQVLLIERESGLLLAASALEGDTQDADVVSGMLDAIRLFVQDAFDAEESSGLQDLRVGNTSVLVEWGPRAVLASVVDGVPDDAYRVRAAQLLESLHVKYQQDLSANSGVTSSLDNAIPLLHDLQVSPVPERKFPWPLVIAITVLLLVIAAVIYFVWVR